MAHHFRPVLSIAMLGLVFASPLAAQGEKSPGAAGEEKADLQSVLEQARERAKVPAMAFVAVRSEEVLASGASGTTIAGGGTAVTGASRWHLGSCTKSMTALLVAQLVDEGRLRFDMTLPEAFPELDETMHDDYRKVTLADLLHHRGGIPQFTAGNAPESALKRGLEGTPLDQRRTFAKRVLEKPPANAPRTKMLYSNGGYGIAAAAAERAAGKDWETMMAERVFAPLKMGSAGIGWPASAERPDEPRGHWGGADQLEALAPGHPYVLESCIDPAGDVHASIDDCGRYLQLHLRGLRGAKTLVKAETMRTLHEPVGGYAMGWGRFERDGMKGSAHDGSAGTFYTTFLVLPEADLALAVCANAGHADGACHEIVAALIERFVRRAPPPPPAGR